jgi:branched-chain amino acid transport system substrate-binding protein
MSRIFRILFVVTVILALVGCGAADTGVADTVTEADAGVEADTSSADVGAEADTDGEAEAVDEPEVVPMETSTLVIVFTASQTGKYNVESSRQINGLNLWLDDVNGSEFVVGDTILTFESIFYDDESTTERVQELYTRLATEDNADFLISPYSSGLTDASAVIAEQYGKMMVTTGAASDGTYQKGFSLVYQTYTPASRYLAGAIDQLAYIGPDVKKIAFVYENDLFSTDVATAAMTYAEGLGYEIVLFEGYDSGTTDFGPIINKVAAAGPEAILGGGHFQDGSAFARQMNEKNIDVQYIALLVAPPDPAFAELGDAALGIVGPSQWEPDATYSSEAAAELGIEWYGPSVEEFVSAYNEAYGENPSYHAAGGYIAGLILQKAIEDAGSTDPEAVKAAMDDLDILTFYGRIKFDTSPDNHGLQIGHDMVYIQWQDNGGLVKELTWPLAAATAETLFPLQ